MKLSKPDNGVEMGRIMSTDKAAMKHFNEWAKDKNSLFEELKVGKRIEGDVNPKKGTAIGNPQHN